MDSVGACQNWNIVEKNCTFYTVKTAHTHLPLPAEYKGQDQLHMQRNYKWSLILPHEKLDFELNIYPLKNYCCYFELN